MNLDLKGITSPGDILEVYQGKRKFEYTILDIYQQYLDMLESFQGTPKALAEGTMKNWRIRLANFKTFLSAVGYQVLYVSQVEGRFCGRIQTLADEGKMFFS